MFNSTSRTMTQTTGRVSPSLFYERATEFVPTVGQSFGAALETTWDTISPARAVEDIYLSLAAAVDSDRFKDEADYQRSDAYRADLPYDPARTKSEMRILAENYDNRRRREYIAQQTNQYGSYFQKGAAFAGGLIGGLPDPLNFLLPGGAGLVRGMAARGAQSVASMARQSFRPSVLGAGFAAGGLSYGFGANILNERGEDIGAQDVMLGAIMGALISPLFGFAGSIGGRSLARRNIRLDVDALGRIVPDNPLYQEALARMKTNDPEGYAQYGFLFERAQAELGYKQSLHDSVRKGLTPEQTTILARYFDDALLRITSGESPDAAGAGAQADVAVRDLADAVNRVRDQQAGGEVAAASSALDQLRAQATRAESQAARLREQMLSQARLVFDDVLGDNRSRSSDRYVNQQAGQSIVLGEIVREFDNLIARFREALAAGRPLDLDAEFTAIRRTIHEWNEGQGQPFTPDWLDYALLRTHEEVYQDWIGGELGARDTQAQLDNLRSTLGIEQADPAKVDWAAMDYMLGREPDDLPPLKPQTETEPTLAPRENALESPQTAREPLPDAGYYERQLERSGSLTDAARAELAEETNRVKRNRNQARDALQCIIGMV